MLSASTPRRRNLPDIYNAVVWTASTLDFLSQSERFNGVVDRLSGAIDMQVVLAPGSTDPDKIRGTFPPSANSKIVLAAGSSLDDPSLVPLKEYRAVLTEGLDQIWLLAKEKSTRSILGGIGALVPSVDLAVNDAKDLLPEDKSGVRWFAIQAADYTFIGPELPVLAELILIYHGIDPERTLWLCCLPEAQGNLSLDASILLRRNRPTKIRPVLVGVHKLPKDVGEYLGEANFVAVVGKDRDVQLNSISEAVFSPALRLHPDCNLLQSRQIFRDLERFRNVGRFNRQRAWDVVREWYVHSAVQAQPWLSSVYESLPKDGVVFDNKSGAIAFDSYEWENEVRRKVLKGSDFRWRAVIDYFEQRLGGQWQTDRPNLARRLETPTKTILRGEEYYYNMANVPPVDRISKIARDFFGGLFKICDLRSLFIEWDALWKWKLTLALCDQLRNCVLQLNWFAYQMSTREQTRTGPTPAELIPVIHALTDATVGLYYSTLLFNGERALVYLNTVFAHKDLAIQYVNQAVQRLEASATEKQDMTFTHKVVRRWREADHPGDNLLTAIQALMFGRDHNLQDTLAVGISWGGIELPLVFKHVCEIFDSVSPVVLVADYSHYRQGTVLEELPYIALVSGSPIEPLPQQDVIVFDDNVLTGLTIQRVHDDLLKRDCRVHAVFVTRISGGRRYGQMRMKDHGVLNPALAGKFVDGFLGETPFALTWSRVEYANPLGVFSLAKRRILELLHANSSVERYDREGF